MLERHNSRYRVLEQIGSGGMSVVYKGHDTSLDREVAIKVLHPHLAQKEDSRRRFSREARAVAKLHHPNILEIFDFSGDEAPEAFIVTEYIRGSTLRALADSVRFHPPEIAAMAVHELAGALEHAHALGIIHRDLKPENVMIRHDGLLKLMDFGIAKVLDRDERMTMTGALVGSPAHMAPEIIEGQESGREADIFSLGTILYWLCCRKLPFQGNNTTQTLKLILEGTYPDPRIECPALSDELTEVIARCLARDPLARYATSEELRAALAEALTSVGIDRPGEELQSFFLEPESYTPRLQSRLVERLLGDAERCSRGPERDPAKVLDRVNRVLALEPGNTRAQSLLENMKRRRRRLRQLSSTGAAVGIALLIASTGLVVWKGRAPNGADLPPNPVPIPVQPSFVVPPALPPVDPSVAAASAGQPERPASPPGVEPDPAPPEETRTAEAELETTARATPSARPPVEPSETAPRPPPTKAAPKSRASEPRPTPPTPVEPAAAPAAVDDQELTIRVKPPHFTRIFLDGKHVNQDRPTFHDLVPAGRHRIRIESDSCETWEDEFQLEAPTIKEAKMARKPSLLTVLSPVKDAFVVINGSVRGTVADSERDPIAVPLPDDSLRGRVRIILSHPDYRDLDTTEEFVAGEHRKLELHLEAK